jgi:hypothetical protein
MWNFCAAFTPACVRRGRVSDVAKLVDLGKVLRSPPNTDGAAHHHEALLDDG